MKNKKIKKSISHNKSQNNSKLLEIEIINKGISMLIEEYGYSKEQIRSNYQLKFSNEDTKNRSGSFVDIAVLDSNEEEKIIVEVKSPIRKLDTETSIWDLTSKILKSNAKFGILYNGKKQFIFKKILDSEVIEIPRLPSKNEKLRAYGDDSLKIKYDEYFFKTCELFRGHIDAEKYIEVLVQILFAKYIDEKMFGNSKLINSSAKNINADIQQLLEAGEIEFKIYLSRNLSFEFIDGETLFKIIQENKNFIISESNSESIIQSIYHLISNLRSKYGRFTYSKSIVLLMYKFLISGATNNDIQNRRLLLTNTNYGKIVFDTLQNISEEFELVGKDLREFSNSNLTVIEINENYNEILKFLLLLKEYDPTIVHSMEPLEFTNEIQHTGIMGFPPIGSKIRGITTDEPEKFGNDYISNYIIQMGDNISPSGYFTLIVSGSYLFSTSSKKSRDELLEKYFLRGIIGFPSQIIPETSIPVYLIFLQKKTEQNDDDYQVFMSDLSKEEFIARNILNPKSYQNVWKKFIEFQTINRIIDEEDTSFSISIKELQDIDNWVPSILSPSARFYDNLKGKYLSDIVEFISPNITTNIENDEIQNNETIEIPEIRISDIDENGIINKNIVKTIKINKSYKADYKRGDIILFTTGSSLGKFAEIRKEHENCSINKNCIILRPKIENSKILYLLGTDYFQNQLKRFAVGSVIQYLRKSDLISIIVPDSILNNKNIHKIESMKKEIEDIQNQLKNKIREYEKIRKELEFDR
jgi:hypothetical protein